MQELIEYIESNEIVYNKDLILKLKELIEKEKEQIVDFAYGCVQHISREDIEEYYNKIYNQIK